MSYELVQYIGRAMVACETLYSFESNGMPHDAVPRPEDVPDMKELRDALRAWRDAQPVRACRHALSRKDSVWKASAWKNIDGCPRSTRGLITGAASEVTVTYGSARNHVMGATVRRLVRVALRQRQRWTVVRVRGPIRPKHRLTRGTNGGTMSYASWILAASHLGTPGAIGTLNVEPVDIDEFLDANRDGLHPDELAEIRSLQPGHTFYSGGGASPEWSITRVGDNPLVRCPKCKSLDVRIRATVDANTDHIREYDEGGVCGRCRKAFGSPETVPGTEPGDDFKCNSCGEYHPGGRCPACGSESAARFEGQASLEP